MAGNYISKEDLSKAIIDSIKSDGIDINKSLITIISDKIYSMISDHLVNGDRVELDGIGEIHASWRGVGPHVSPKGYAIKVVIDANEEMKSKIEQAMLDRGEISVNKQT